jgi:hypothetical protein
MNEVMARIREARTDGDLIWHPMNVLYGTESTEYMCVI